VWRRGAARRAAHSAARNFNVNRGARTLLIIQRMVPRVLLFTILSSCCALDNGFPRAGRAFNAHMLRPTCDRPLRPQLRP
jgi:hypothetical protein